MTATFQFIALPHERFAPLFAQGDAELRRAGIRRMVVDAKPGFPCRVSLADAEVGETVLLLPFTHHDADSPYRASGPIFVRQGARTATPAPGEIPAMFHHRQLSVRAYDAGGMMVDASVIEGRDLDATIRRLLGRDDVAYLHVHNARPGCYNATVVRA